MRYSFTYLITLPANLFTEFPYSLALFSFISVLIYLFILQPVYQSRCLFSFFYFFIYLFVIIFLFTYLPIHFIIYSLIYLFIIIFFVYFSIYSIFHYLVYLFAILSLLISLLIYFHKWVKDSFFTRVTVIIVCSIICFYLFLLPFFFCLRYTSLLLSQRLLLASFLLLWYRHSFLFSFIFFLYTFFFQLMYISRYTFVNCFSFAAAFLFYTLDSVFCSIQSYDFVGVNIRFSNLTPHKRSRGWSKEGRKKAGFIIERQGVSIGGLKKIRNDDWKREVDLGRSYHAWER